MSARRTCLAALSVFAFAWALAGCGGVSTSPASDNVGKQLTIYSGLPLQGPSAAVSKQIVGGEKLALSDAGGRIGSLTVSYVSLDDSNPVSGQWDPGVTAANAKAVAQDPTTIAYLGDYNSGATAVSLPLINAAGILQVSPSSPYVGLTSSLDAGQDEPERFYPTGKRTFGRVAQGDQVQAAAQIALLRAEGVHRVYVLADQDPFDGPLAQIVADDVQRAGIELVGQDTIVSFTGEFTKVAESGAQAVFVSATATSNAALFFRQLHAADSHMMLLASSSMLNTVFTSNLGAAESATTIGSPVLPLSSYPSSANRVLTRYRRRFAAPPGPYVLYGYEAMSVVLAAIRDAGSHGDDRQAVIDKLLTTHGRQSVLGDYSIRPNGETTLSDYAIDRIVRGMAVYWRAFHAPA